tara:strand:+ start:1356 stop:1913 length:558 start_codon:yes stop_codon:yes gene_type:complete
MTTVEIREIYQNQQDTIVSKNACKVLVSHFGAFSQDLVNSLTLNVENLLQSKNIKKQVIKRIFSILIEGLQNIRLHGQKDEASRQLGYFILSESCDKFHISLANLISSDDFKKVDNYIERINNYSEQELKKTYLAVLENEFLSTKGRAGLGFITTRIKSGSPLKHSYFALKGGSFLFTFRIDLEK